ncbi:hypothetical protein Q1695_003848 [Nippostrongylus brasiliensis]|nr:hypothetical protein Q1695_003848 [Nippostrongylus brasiliensis]
MSFVWMIFFVFICFAAADSNKETDASDTCLEVAALCVRDCYKIHKNKQYCTDKQKIALYRCAYPVLSSLSQVDVCSPVACSIAARRGRLEQKRKRVMRFVWAIFFVILGYAATVELLPDNHPIVETCFEDAVKCRDECATKNTRQHCVMVCGMKGNDEAAGKTSV